MSTLDVAHSYTFAAATPRPLFVHVPNVRIVVRSHDASELAVEIRSDAPPEELETLLNRLNLTTRAAEETVRIQTDMRRQQKRASWWRTQESSAWPVTLHIRMPPGTHADLQAPGGSIDMEGVRGQITAECAGGAIDIQDVQGRLDVKAFNGTVNISDVEGSVLSVCGAGRSVKLHDIAADETRLWTASASTDLRAITGTLQLTTHGGSTRAVSLAGPLQADVHGGTGRIHLPPAPARVHAPGADLTMRLAHPCQLDVEAQVLETPPSLPLAAKTVQHASGAFMGGGPSVKASAMGGRLALETA